MFRYALLCLCMHICLFSAREALYRRGYPQCFASSLFFFFFSLLLYIYMYICIYIYIWFCTFCMINKIQRPGGPLPPRLREGPARGAHGPRGRGGISFLYLCFSCLIFLFILCLFVLFWKTLFFQIVMFNDYFWRDFCFPEHTGHEDEAATPSLYTCVYIYIYIYIIIMIIMIIIVII